MESVDINDVSTVIAIISGILSITSVAITKLKKSQKRKKDVDIIIRKAIDYRENELINNYFQNLSHADIIRIRQKNLEIDNNIRFMIKSSLENNLENPWQKSLNIALNEITRGDRYWIIKFILSKINRNDSFTRSISFTLALLSNYIFYLSKFLLYLFIYALTIFIFASPFYLILVVLYTLYKALEIEVLLMIVSILILPLFVFGKKQEH